MIRVGRTWAVTLAVAACCALGSPAFATAENIMTPPLQETEPIEEVQGDPGDQQVPGDTTEGPQEGQDGTDGTGEEEPGAEETPSEEPGQQYVARIDDTSYKSIDDAIENAGDGGTITLLADCKLGKTFDKSLTFKGGYTLSASVYGWRYNGTLTFDGANFNITSDASSAKADNDDAYKWVTMILDGALVAKNRANVQFAFDSAAGTNCGIYAAKSDKGGTEGVTIRVEDHSRFSITGKNTLGVDGQGIQLDSTANTGIFVTDHSSFLIDGTNRGYVNSPKICVEDSGFTVKNCTANASNGGEFTAINSVVSYTGNAGHGLSANSVSLTDSTHFAAENNGYYGITCYGDFFIDGSCVVDVARNSRNGDFAGLKLTSGVTKGLVEKGATVNIVDNYCSGLSNNGKVVFEDGVKLTITGNLNDKGNTSNGGGIYNSGASANLTLPHDAVIYNNHTKTAGDDIFNNTTSTITFPGVGSGWRLDGEGIGSQPDDCNDTIDGWYLDGAKAKGDGTFELTPNENRWEAHANTIGGIYAEKYDPFAKDKGEGAGEDTGEDAGEGTGTESILSSLIALFTGDDGSGDGNAGSGDDGSGDGNAGSGDDGSGDGSAGSGDDGSGDGSAGSGADDPADPGDGVDEGFSQPSAVTVTGPIALKAAHGLGTVAVDPADITIYKGGDNGYEAVIGDQTSEENKKNSLPEPGFYFTLPDDVNAALQEHLEETGVLEDELDEEYVDLSDYMRIYTNGNDGGNEFHWILQRYGDEHSGAYGKFIYRIVPANAEGDPDESAQPARLQFTSTEPDEDGNYQTFTSSDFDLKDIDSLQQQYAMKLYTDLVDDDKVVFEVDTNGFDVDGGLKYFNSMELWEGTLSIRYTTDAVKVTEALDETADVDALMADPKNAGNAYATHPTNTKFYINGSEVDVATEGANAAAPSLLFDDLLDKGDLGSAQYGEKLADKARDALSGKNIHVDGYEAKYLDLVDANNANVWLKAGHPTTVYWPYPEDTGRNTQFYLVHVEGLHRDTSLADGEFTQAIDDADAVLVPVEYTDYGIKFTTDGFSPFVLVWGDTVPDTPDTPDPDDPPVIIPDDPDPSDPSKPDTPVEKELDGRDLVAGEFSFTITATGANAKNVSPKSLTGRNDASGNVTFTGDGFTFEETGTYTFTVAEKLPFDDDPDAEGVQSGGVTYDESTYTLTAKVTKGTGNKLAVSWQAPERSVSFRNTYEPSGSVDVSLGATKVLEGRDLAAGEFTFELRDRNGQLVATAKNAADGSVSFAALHLTEPGTYTYTITEVKGDLEGVTYDTSTHTAVITVTDNGDGTLSATVSYDGGGQLPVFTNSYEEPAEPGKPSEPGQPSEPGKPGGGKPGASIPQTGDTIVLAVGGVAVAAAAAIGAGLYLRRRSAR